jgi:hypothetical protein
VQQKGDVRHVRVRLDDALRSPERLDAPVHEHREHPEALDLAEMLRHLGDLRLNPDELEHRPREVEPREEQREADQHQDHDGALRPQSDQLVVFRTESLRSQRVQPAHAAKHQAHSGHRDPESP